MRRWMLRQRLQRELRNGEGAPSKSKAWKALVVLRAWWNWNLLFITYPIRFVARKAGKWLDRQSAGTWFVFACIIMFTAIVIGVKLRYGYWLTIMKSNYPQDTLVAVDKVLVEWNARMNALHYFIYMNVLAIVYATVARRYSCSKPQVMPRMRRVMMQR